MDLNLGLGNLGNSGGIPAAPSPQIQLSGGTVAESASVGDLWGTLSVSNLPDGVTVTGYSITVDDDSVAQLDAGDDTLLEVGGALDWDALPVGQKYHLVTVQATLSAGDPLTRELTLNVTNVLEVTLATKTLSAATFTDEDAPGTIIGAIQNLTAGSTVSITPNDGRVAIDGSNNLIVGMSAASVGAFNITIRETHPDANNTPKDDVFEITVTDVVETVETISQTSITKDGFTYSFYADEDMTTPLAVDTFVDVNGKMHAYSNQDIYVADGVPSSQINGAWANGLMVDPFTKDGQAFDEFIGTGTGSPSSANTPYVHASNVSVGATGVAYYVPSGSDISLVKALRRSGVTDENQWQTIEADGYVPIHFLSELPPADFYAPSPSAVGANKVIKTRSQLRKNVLGGYTMPGAFTYAYSDVAETVPSDLGMYGSTGHTLRRFRLQNELAQGGTSSNYSGHFAFLHARALYLLQSDALSTVEQDALIDLIAPFGIQIQGLSTRGSSVGDGIGGAGIGAGAGQQGAFHTYIYYGAFLFGDTDMLATAQALNSNMNANCKYVDFADVGTAAPGKAGVNAQTFFDEHVGTPHIIPDEWASNMDSRYGGTAARTSVFETMAVKMLRNGPGGITGAQALLKGGAFSAANDNSAHIAFMDRYRTWEAYPTALSYAPEADWKAIYDQERTNLLASVWTGRPDQVPNDLVGEGYITAIDGGFEWDFTGLNYSTEPVVQINVLYSYDNIQWFEITDAGTTGSKTGLIIGHPYYVGVQLVGETSGAGPRSWNYPRNSPITSGTFRNLVTPTGTGSATAPSWPVGGEPALCHKPHPAWGGIYYVVTPATAPVIATELVCGAGDPQGWPAPSIGSFQHDRDASPISGATSAAYELVVADLETDHTCDVTASNASGTPSTTTAAVTVFAAPAIPSDTIIDTDCGYGSTLFWPNVFASISPQRCNLVHQPGVSFIADGEVEGDPDIILGSIGAWVGDKTSNYPYLDEMDLAAEKPLTPGQSYDVEVDVIIGFDKDGNEISFNGSLRYSIGNNTDQYLYSGGGANIDVPTPNQPFLYTISQTINVDISETDPSLRVDLGNQTATGGTSGGDIPVVGIRVRDAA